MYLSWTLGASILNTAINMKRDKNNKLTNKQISKIVIFGIVSVQILWQIIHELDIDLFNKIKNKRDESIFLPIVGIWTGLGILTNNENIETTFKALPLIVSCITTKFHLQKVNIKSNNPLKIIEKLRKLLLSKNNK